MSKAEILAFVGLACLMVFYAAQRLQGLELASFESLASGRDDWNRYARHAVDIHSKGLLMPEISCPYEGPGGFLYNYFLSIFLLLGIKNVAWVYVVQVGMLFGTALLLYKAWRPISENLLYRFLLFVFVPLCVVLDMLPYYAFRLMSENLALFLLAVFLISAEKFFESYQRFKASYLLIAGFSLGLLVITRPQIILFIPVFGAISLYFVIKRLRLKSALRRTFVLGFLIPFVLGSLIAVRNLILCGTCAMLPGEGLNYALDSGTSNNVFYFCKILFIVGWLNALEPDYSVRPQWILGWTMFFFSLLSYLTGDRKTILNNESYMVRFLFLLYYTVTLFFVEITSYGYRYVIPAMPLVWSLALTLFSDHLKSKNIRATGTG